LKLPDIDAMVAIDIHTHCGRALRMHANDGYDDFQRRWRTISSRRHKHPRRAGDRRLLSRQEVAAVIFPVDAERETGFRRYNNHEMLEVASEHLDVAIPFVSIDPHRASSGCARRGG